MLWFSRKKQRKELLARIEAAVKSLRSSPAFSNGFSDQFYSNILSWEAELGRVAGELYQVMPKGTEFAALFDRELEKVHADFYVRAFRQAEGAFEGLQWYKGFLSVLEGMASELGSMLRHVPRNRDLTKAHQAVLSALGGVRFGFRGVEECAPVLDALRGDIHRFINQQTATGAQEIRRKFSLLANFVHGTESAYRMRADRFDVETFMKEYVRFHVLYFTLVFSALASREAERMLKAYVDRPSDRILEKHAKIVSAVERKVARRLEKLTATVPAEQRQSLEDLTKVVLPFIDKVRQTDFKGSILASYGKRLILQGYEEGNQSKIYAGSQLYFDLYASPQPIPMEHSAKMTLVHGVSPIVQDSAGSWVGAVERAGGRNPARVTPEEYVERVASILATGLRPSERKDSQFYSPELSRLQEVWFFDGRTTAYSYYGFVSLLLQPEGKYVIFRGTIDAGEYGNELFILTKHPIRERFIVVLPKRFAQDRGNLLLSDGRRVSQQEYLVAVRESLQRRGIAFEER